MPKLPAEPGESPPIAYADRKAEETKRLAAMFKLYYVHGLSAREIAKLHNMSVEAVENALLRIMRQLRQSAKSPVES